MIPSVLHFIWISLGQDLPDHYRRCIVSGVKNTNCQVVLHTDDTSVAIPGVEIRIRDFNFTVKDVTYDPLQQCEQGKRISHLKDIYRLEILYKEGGIYSDLDVLWLKNPWDLLHHKCFIAYQAEQYKTLCNAIIGSEPNHPAIKLYRDWCIESFPPTRYWSIANPYTIWKDRDDVSFLKQAVFFPYPYYKDASYTDTDTGRKRLAAATACHLNCCRTRSLESNFFKSIFAYLE